MRDLTIPRAGYTPIDNYFLDHIVPDLTISEVKVYLQLNYECYYGGSEIISISYRDLATRSGLSASSAKRAVWMLYARRLIDKEIIADSDGLHEGNRYRLLPLPEGPVQE